MMYLINGSKMMKKEIEMIIMLMNELLKINT